MEMGRLTEDSIRGMDDDKSNTISSNAGGVKYSNTSKEREITKPELRGKTWCRAHTDRLQVLLEYMRPNTEI